MTKNDIILAVIAGNLSINDLKAAVAALTNFIDINCPPAVRETGQKFKKSLAEVNHTLFSRQEMVSRVREVVQGHSLMPLKRDQKISAIKAFKDMVDSGLADAKMWVEQFMCEFGGDINNKIW